MTRILVVGNLGSGHVKKAQTLAKELTLPFVDLDCLYWQPGWKLASFAERERSLNELSAQKSWVAAGQAKKLRDVADRTIFVRRSKWLCLATYLILSLPFLFRSRPGMPSHCPEILGLYPNILRIIRFDQDNG